MDKEHATVLQAAIAYTFEVQWRLDGRIAHHACSSGKVAAIHVESANHKERVVEALYGKALMRMRDEL